MVRACFYLGERKALISLSTSMKTEDKTPNDNSA